MRPEDLYNAIGNIDDRYIDTRPIKDIPKPKRTPLWIKLVSAVACAALLALVGVNILQKDTPPTDIVYPSDIVYPAENTPSDYMSGQNMWDESVFKEFSYADLAERAALIVVADVTDVVLEHAKSYDENTFLSYAKVSVCEVLKGDVAIGESLYVSDNGLMCVDLSVALTYSGGPLMEKGNRVLLFIKPYTTRTMENGEHFYVFLSRFLGPFFYDEDGKYHEVWCYSDRDPITTIMPTKLADYEPKTLEEIKELIGK